MGFLTKTEGRVFETQYPIGGDALVHHQMAGSVQQVLFKKLE